MSKLKNIWEKYKKIGILGSAIFGNVYKAKSKYNNEYFEIKEIKKIKSDKDTLLREIEVMKKMECDNIVKLIESIETQESFYIVSELCYLNLEQYLKKRKKAFSVEEIKDNKYEYLKTIIRYFKACFIHIIFIKC